MGRLTEGGNESRRGELEIGETREIVGRDKHGEEVKRSTLTRTSRPYAYDLADAYNQGRPDDGKSWFVDHSGNLRFGDTPEGERRAAKQIVKRRETERDRWLRNFYAEKPAYDRAA